MTSVLAHQQGHRARPARLPGRRSDAHLWERHHDHDDAAAREALIERFMPLARRLARRYQRRTEPIDDLLQVANMGLVKAVDRFDPSRGTAFSTYAVPTILGELKRYLRDSSWALHVPRGMQERAMKLERAAEDLRGRLGRSPTTTELAGELDLTSEELLEAMDAASAFRSASLDEEYGDSDSREPVYADSLGRMDDRFDLVEHWVTIAPSILKLGHRERLILRLRFAEDLRQSEIADLIGVSQMHVSRLLRRSLEELRASMGVAQA